MITRPLQRDEASKLVDELWLPLGHEMTELNEYNRLAEEPREDAIDYYKNSIDDDQQIIFVAIKNGEFIGYIYGMQIIARPVFARGDKLYIYESYVREEFRRQGVISELLTKLEAWGLKQNCETSWFATDMNNKANIMAAEENGYESEKYLFSKTL